MKKSFFAKPENLAGVDLYGFSWLDYLTAIPSPIAVATSYKSNGKANACMQSWMSFAGDDDAFYALLASVNPQGHMYQALKATGAVVLNFPSPDLYKQCALSIEHNGPDDDEIAATGLTAEPAEKINAPAIAECFLQLECVPHWEKDLARGAVAMALRVVNIRMESDRYDSAGKGRYGETGYLYNVVSAFNPDTGVMEPFSMAAIRVLGPM